MQDLIKITPESLQLQLCNIPFGTLKRLYEELYQYMRNSGDAASDEQIIGVQRKLTKIQGEINRRYKLNPEFHAWERNLMRRLKRG